MHFCCGPTFAIEALAAGNLREDGLDVVVERAEWNPLYNALALGNGPCYLAEALVEAGHGGFIRDGYASSCHACQHILSRPGVEAILQQALEPQRAELFLKRTILDQVAADRTADVLRI